MNNNHNKITDSEFDKVINSDTNPIVVDFWAPWCGPCQMLSPILDEVIEKIGESAKIFKLNIDENPETANKFKIMSIPTVIIFKDGEVKETLIGVQSVDVYEEAIKKHL